MKLTTALGVAFASLAMAAYAQSEHPRVIVRHAGPTMNADSDGDGWMTRAEAGAAAERIFTELDSNHDGRLDSQDHGEGEFDIRIEDLDEAPELDGDNCTTTVEPANAPEGAERRVTVICHGEGENGERRTDRRVTVERRGEAPRAESREEHAERRVERRVVIISGDDAEGDDAIAPTPPIPPMPPHAPMFFMALGSPGEADLNGDGAMSLDEFRAQHLRFFDASDANGDGRVRVETPHWEAPEPPTAPTPPAPPRPPRRH